MPKDKSLLKASKQALRTIGSGNPVTQVIYNAEIVWKDGVPVLVNAPQCISLSPEQALQELMKKCLDLPYDGRDPSLKGLKQGEAIIVNLIRDAAHGSPEARSAVLDRLLGRPQQNIKSIHLTGDLNSFLDKVAEQAKIETIDLPPPTPETYDGEDL